MNGDAAAAWSYMGHLRTGTALTDVQELDLDVAHDPAGAIALSEALEREIYEQGVFSFKVILGESREVEQVIFGLPSGRVGVFYAAQIRNGLQLCTDWRRVVPPRLAAIVDEEHVVQLSERSGHATRLHQVDTAELGLKVTKQEEHNPWRFSAAHDWGNVEEVAGALNGSPIRAANYYRWSDDANALRFRERYNHANTRPAHHLPNVVHDWVDNLHDGDDVQARLQRAYLYAVGQAPFCVLFAYAVISSLGGRPYVGRGDRVQVAQRTAARLVQARCERLELNLPLAAARFVLMNIGCDPVPDHLLPLDLRYDPKTVEDCPTCGARYGEPVGNYGELHLPNNCPEEERMRADIAAGGRHPAQMYCGYPFCKYGRPHLARACPYGVRICRLCKMRGHSTLECLEYPKEELIAIHNLFVLVLPERYRSSNSWLAEAGHRASRTTLRPLRAGDDTLWVEPALIDTADAIEDVDTIARIIRYRRQHSLVETLRRFEH